MTDTAKDMILILAGYFIGVLVGFFLRGRGKSE